MTEKLSARQIEHILSSAGKPEAKIAEELGVSRWVVHHYLVQGGKTSPGLGNFPMPPEGKTQKLGTFAVYYNKNTARKGYPWVLEGEDGTTQLAKSVRLVLVEFGPECHAWTDFDPSPNPRLTKRPSYVRAVMMLKGLIEVTA